MSVKRNDIIKFCAEYLKVQNFQDGCHNGLQVPGAETVERIVTGVTLSKQLIEAAIENNAQMIMVHHGLFDNDFGKTPVINPVVAERLKLLLMHNINLCGYHLPIDAHPVIGNNISLCKTLGATKTKPFDVGYIGILKKPMLFNDFVSLVERKISVKANIIAGNSKTVKTVAILSGGGSPYFLAAHEAGADTFLTGDMWEQVVRGAEEVGINYISIGHYNSEKVGIQNLGVLLAKKFKIKAEFVDVPCAM